LFLASVLMGVAISGMHYTGMFAATFIHDDRSNRRIESALSSGLAIATLSTTALILGIAWPHRSAKGLWHRQETQRTNSQLE